MVEATLADAFIDLLYIIHYIRINILKQLQEVAGRKTHEPFSMVG